MLRNEVVYVLAVELHDIAFRAFLVLIVFGVFEEDEAEAAFNIDALDWDGVEPGHDGAAEDVFNVFGLAFHAEIAQEQVTDRGAERALVAVVIHGAVEAFVGLGDRWTVHFQSDYSGPFRLV